MRKRLVVVGSGIVGLAHAIAAKRSGWAVTILEATQQPLGASVRNFGTVWPIGQPRGTRRELGIRSSWRWKELSESAAFWLRDTGSLHLAYTKEGWDVLNEYAAKGGDDELVTLLSPERTLHEHPAVKSDGLLGALYSEHEVAVEPAEAIRKLVDLLASRGVDVRFGALARAVRDNAVELSTGEQVPFDRLSVCCGDQVKLLYPEAIKEASGPRCKLQMLRTESQPDDFEIDPTVVADLTLAHYEAFADCPSIGKLRERLAADYPDCVQHGIHVIAAQKADGSLILGDSHLNGEDFVAGTDESIDQSILAYLARFLAVPDLTISRKWSGTYLKPKNGSYVTVIDPDPSVQVVTGLGGAGMTLSFALAEDLVASW